MTGEIDQGCSEMPPPQSKKAEGDEGWWSQAKHIWNLLWERLRSTIEKEGVCEIISQVDDNKQTPDPSFEESSIEKHKC